MPFLLYDRVIVDDVAFRCLIGELPSLKGWAPSSESVRIVERLADDGVLQRADYGSLVAKCDAEDALDAAVLADLEDPRILNAAQQSLDLWLKLATRLFGVSDARLAKLTRLMEVMSDPTSPHRRQVAGFVYECVGDINRMLLLSAEMQLPVYDWEDYQAFLRVKRLRVASRDAGTPGQRMRDLFSLFLPDFRVADYDHLRDLRKDSRLDPVRALARGTTPIDDELKVAAQEELLTRSYKVDRYSRLVGYSTAAMFLLPRAVPTTISIAARALIRRWIERDVKWQTFFIERATAYTRRDAERSLTAEPEDC